MAADSWTPVIPAIAALAGALGGVWLTQRETGSREKRQYERQLSDKRDERQQQLYLDMAGHVAATESWIDLITDMNTSWVDRSVSRPELSQPLTPRVELWADDKLAESWREYKTNISTLDASYRSAHDGTDPDPVLNRDSKRVSETEASISALKAQLRSAAAS